AVGFYVAKYVNKKSDMDLAAKGLGAKEWNNSLKTKLSLLPKKLFRIRMSRNFGMKMLTMTNLSTECLIQLTKLGYDATPFNQILKQNEKREMRLRLGKVIVADVLAAKLVTKILLKFMRASIKRIGVSNLQSFIASMTQKLTLRIFLMSRKIILIKQELLLLVYELNRSGLLAENEKIRPILAQLEKLLLCDLSPSTNDSVKN